MSTPPTEPAGRALSEREAAAIDAAVEEALTTAAAERRPTGHIIRAAVERIAAEHYAAGLAAGRRDGAVEALTEVERRIEREGVLSGAISIGYARRIVLDYREEMHRDA